MEIHSPTRVPTPDPIAELERLGDEIAELSAHLDAAPARLLDLIREFDARQGWSHVAQGLSIHARTSLPGWLGEPLDVGWAIDVLHPLAAGRR